ncbi:hypothetical protein CLU82_3660 [Flavobacterium sp. 5]|nr:hypothetical protein CLU82_3660 [Flavobacterium sp. 5]
MVTKIKKKGLDNVIPILLVSFGIGMVTYKLYKWQKQK